MRSFTGLHLLAVVSLACCFGAYHLREYMEVLVVIGLAPWLAVLMGVIKPTTPFGRIQ